MNTDDINGFLDNMTRESEKEILRVREAGQERIREFKAETEREFSEYMNSLRQEEELFAKETIAMERNRWSLEFRRTKLQEYENFFNERITDAIKYFREEKRDLYTQWMIETLCGILDETGEGPVEITISPDDRELDHVLKDEYVRRGGRVENINIKAHIFHVPGGMRVRCLDKPLAYDSTVERILSRSMEDLRLAVRDCLVKAGKNPDIAGGAPGGN